MIQQKLFSDLVKLLNTSAKLFFSCSLSTKITRERIYIKKFFLFLFYHFFISFSQKELGEKNMGDQS